jgi:hypothetical protein
MSLIYNAFSYMFGSKKKEEVVEIMQPINDKSSSSYDQVLNLFYNVHRDTGDMDLRNAVINSAQESLMYTLKIIAYNRSVRGERDLGRRLLGWLQKYDEQQLIENMPLFLNKYGRYDDLIYLPRKSKAMHAYLKHLGEQLVADLANMEQGKTVSLAAKWVPSETSAVNRETAITFRLARTMKVSMSDLRKKYLTPLRTYIGVLEQKMCAGNWSSIDYASLSAEAFKRHIRAFEENDGERFAEYMKSRVPKNLTTLPHEIIAPYFNGQPLDESIEIQWREIGYKLNKTVVLGNKSLISTTLGLLAEHVITVESVPRLVEITGETVFEKVQNVLNEAIGEVSEVPIDICASLKLIFDNMGAEKLIIVSDKPLTKVDSLYNNATKETVEKMFLDAGLKMPQIVFWNTRNDMVNCNDSVHCDDSVQFSEIFGITAVSGFSLDVLQCILKNELPTPVNVMMNALSNEKFDEIKIGEPTVPL